ncbi:ATP-binding cassette superfamily [Micromonas pusilla CCMP1545]|uniref:ATP-binding cassette superfamily n=1 Tax=Micromonas pusilla (strain CCMP1545) TaxID=564608 RepID=C1MX61_MICPC|nr:ATP-binding cassette superfamily [Micromonas pusilla CCMP1545]EEH55109.1 ATP-binding cassette superfamily [Micromonas pusilla CCMP1545]|eukprot:XP_003060340.1 ATP-binding cassette superfamily [Micromonas pusilla CCMP1545]
MGKTEDADFHAGVAIVPRKDGVATDGGGGDDEKAAAEGGEDRGQQEMAPFLSLFRFYGPREKAMLAVGVLFCMIGGAAFPVINIAFGELLDSSANNANVKKTTADACLFMVGVACVLGFSLFVGFAFVSWAASRGANNVRRAYLASLVAQDVAFFDAARAGELAAATSEKVQILQNGTAKKLGEFVQATFTGVGGLGVGFYFSWKLSLVICAGLPLLVVATYFLIKATTALTAANPDYENAGAVAVESLTSSRVTAALNDQPAAAARYERHLRGAEAHATKCQWRISFANGGLFGSMFFMYAFGLWYGASGTSPCVTGGTVILVFFSVLIGGFMFGQCGASIEAIIKGRIAARELYAVIDRKPADGTPGADVRDPQGVAVVPSEVSGAVEFKDVCFSYATRPVFVGLNLKIERGSTVALVGESGCGKSTIGRLLTRFYDPTSGMITLDGVDIKSARIDDLRACVGVVSQEPLLFEASIRENIAVGRAGANAADVPIEDIVAAAKAASAHEFIASFPDGYDTIVGGKNSKLSGGQKQRVAIARAALRNPPVLILDEATSALDTENEKIVQNALDDLVKGGARTTIVIAHRLSTVRDADAIVVLGSKDAAGGMAGGGAAEGSVVLERGTHDELMAMKDGRYRSLVGLGKSKGKASSASSASLAGAGETPSASAADLVKLSAEKEEKEADEKDDADEKKASDEEKLPPVPAARIWAYSKPEYNVLAFGGFVALVNGCIFPSIAFVFAEMLALFYSHDTDRIYKWAYIFAGIFAGIAFFSWIVSGTQGGIFGIIGERLTTRLRVHLFRAILRQDVGFFDDPANSVGALTSNLRTDTSAVQSATGKSFGSAVQTFGSLVFGLSVALEASWKFGLVLIACVPVLAVGEMMNMQNLTNGETEVLESLGQSASLVSESAAMIREVKAFGLEKRVYDLYDSLLNVPNKEERNKAFFTSLAFGVAQLVTMLFYAFAFWWGAELMSDGELDFYDFMKALWALGFCAAGAGQAAAFAGDARAANVAASRIFPLIDREPGIDTKPFIDGPPGAVESGGAIIPPDAFKGGIAFKGVQFFYPQRQSKVLNGLDLVINPGETIALIGQSGSGKSTAVQLIERFYDPTTKSVLDGVDLRDLDPMWLRRQIGLVEQEPTLFSGSVHDNIAAGKGGAEASREEVVHAAKIANAHEFITKMDGGYDADVGVGGGLVSGGQKQRIAIARAIIHSPKILLLDEATSALDNESEKLVQAALDALLAERGGDRTTIVIAHRLSTIQNADRICVLENVGGGGAKVVEQGTHDQLMAIPGGRYVALRAAYDDADGER